MPGEIELNIRKHKKLGKTQNSSLVGGNIWQSSRCRCNFSVYSSRSNFSEFRSRSKSNFLRIDTDPIVLSLHIKVYFSEFSKSRSRYFFSSDLDLGFPMFGSILLHTKEPCTKATNQPRLQDTKTASRKRRVTKVKFVTP